MLFALIALCNNAFSQGFKAIIKGKKTNKPLAGATITVLDIKRSSSADERGYVEINDIDSAKHPVEFKYIGYSTLNV